MSSAVISEIMRTLHRIHTQLSDLRGRIAAGPRQVAIHTAQVEAAEAGRTGVQEDVKKAKMAADQIERHMWYVRKVRRLLGFQSNHHWLWHDN